MKVSVKSFDGRTKRIAATCSLTPEGRVEILGEHRTARFLEKYKVRGGGSTYSIDDGAPWLEALPANLRGTYLWAEAVKDGG